MANKKSNAPLYVIIGILSAMLLGGGAFLLTQSKTEVKGNTQVIDVTDKSADSQAAEEVALEKTALKSETPAAEATSVRQVPQSNNDGTLHTYMIGTIGDGRVDYFTVDNSVGSYSYVSNGVQSGKRGLATESYDPKTGRLILRAYAGNKYIGTFNGIYHHYTEYSTDGASNTSDSYEGSFHGYQGAVIPFSLYSD